ncbi:MAG: DNA-binding protein [Chloroflexi bacterium]|nr:DNA-binding protein [Chloroflexota bacterium]MCC6895680.1 DNA-binding protein [Anaerolineae bacterium]
MAKGETNAQIAHVLETIADHLETQNANPFRVRAYRDGADTIRATKQSVAELIHKGQTGKLDDLPNIGSGIIAVVGEYITLGKSSLLEELESANTPVALFSNVPGIGKELASRIVDQLHITTLPALEEAAHNGDLARVEGFGTKRLDGVKTALAGMLSRSARAGQKERTSTSTGKAPKDQPSVELLLEIDADYRKQARAGKLPKIAPKRFNPKGEAWLSILNTKHDDWKFTAMFSNTAQAHKLGKTDDWVVIYFERGGTEHQHTVVTETKGTLKGKRVVRGREGDNQTYYGSVAKSA